MCHGVSTRFAWGIAETHSCWVKRSSALRGGESTDQRSPGATAMGLCDLPVLHAAGPNDQQFTLKFLQSVRGRNGTSIDLSETTKFVSALHLS